MTAEQIFDKVKKIIANHLDIDQAEVTPDKHLESDLGADSLDRIEQLMLVEKEFHLHSIPDEEIRKVATVEDIINIIEKSTNQ